MPCSQATTPYDETATPDSTTPYGAVKAAAETAVRAISPSAVIVRTSLILGNGHSSHERRVHALAAGESSGVLFTNDIRCPVHVSDLAAALLELASTDHTGFSTSLERKLSTATKLGRLIAIPSRFSPPCRPGTRTALG